MCRNTLNLPPERIVSVGSLFLPLSHVNYTFIVGKIQPSFIPRPFEVGTVMSTTMTMCFGVFCLDDVIIDIKKERTSLD